MIKSALDIKLEIYRLIEKYEEEISTTLSYEEHPLKLAELRDRLVLLNNLRDDIFNLGFSLPPERRKYAAKVIRKDVQPQKSSGNLRSGSRYSDPVRGGGDR